MCGERSGYAVCVCVRLCVYVCDCHLVVVIITPAVSLCVVRQLTSGNATLHVVRVRMF